MSTVSSQPTESERSPQRRSFFAWLSPLASVKLTLTLLSLSMILVFVATLEQVRIGIRGAQAEFFESFFGVWRYPEQFWGGSFLNVFPIPIPGGYLLGGLLILNLIAAYLTRFKWTFRKMGIQIIHLGIILLLAGQLFTQAMQVESISTGSLGLDIALGVGGLPKGRVIEVYGPESSGKTTLALHVIAEAQKAGGTAAFVDAEHALDPVYAKKLGVDIEELIVSQPDTGEQALEITDTLVRSNAIDVLVVDSVAALVPRAEIEGEMGDSHVGLQARLMSQSLRKLTGSINRSKCMVIFINQLRMKIGVMYGNPETTTGGNALKFYASVRLDIRRTGQIKDRDEVIGNATRVKVVKNKVAPPFKQVEFDIMYGEGISKIGEILDLGVKAGVVEKSGSWFSYDSVRIGQGRENAKKFLTENTEMCAKLEAAIRGRTDEVAEEMMTGPDADED